MPGWGGDHPDGPEPSRASAAAGLVLLAVVIGLGVAVWVLMAAGLVQAG